MTLTRQRIRAAVIAIALIIMLDVPPSGVSVCEPKRVYYSHTR